MLEKISQPFMLKCTCPSNSGLPSTDALPGRKPGTEGEHYVYVIGHDRDGVNGSVLFFMPGTQHAENRTGGLDGPEPWLPILCDKRHEIPRAGDRDAALV